MRRIGIVGAGQAGLQLALGLRGAGYDVVVLSDRNGADIRYGRITSTQCMFATARSGERAVGAALWDDQCPDIEAMAFTLMAPEGSIAFGWEGTFDAPAQSVDQRLKMPEWMVLLERCGGEVRIANAGVAELEALARECDLVLVATGKGEIGRLFERDAARSPYATPMRALAATYVRGMRPRAGRSAVTFGLFPGVGEYFGFPALTTTGTCDVMVFEGIPGGAMDCWDDVTTPEEHLDMSLALLRRFLPAEYERCAGVRLTDPNATLVGRFAPVVRKPVLRLPSGRAVLGMGDAVCLNDPISGQGTNNASRCASIYLRSIVAPGTRRFDVAWMEATFDRYWEVAGPVTEWTNGLLAPPPPHVVSLLAEAARRPALARWIANGFDDPREVQPAFADPRVAAARLEVT